MLVVGLAAVSACLIHVGRPPTSGAQDAPVSTVRGQVRLPNGAPAPRTTI
jgi:hypothetical protein